MDNVRERSSVIRWQHAYEWLTMRQQPTWRLSDLPEVGYIAYSNDTPVAQASLRICEGNVGMIDSLVSNPNIESHIRDESINLIISRIVAKAKDLKLNSLHGYSKCLNTLIRVERLGFKKLPETIVVLDLRPLEGVIK